MSWTRAVVSMTWVLALLLASAALDTVLSPW
jgi:hypothetical protein